MDRQAPRSKHWRPEPATQHREARQGTRMRRRTTRSCTATRWWAAGQPKYRNPGQTWRAANQSPDTVIHSIIAEEELDPGVWTGHAAPRWRTGSRAGVNRPSSPFRACCPHDQMRSPTTQRSIDSTETRRKQGKRAVPVMMFSPTAAGLAADGLATAGEIHERAGREGSFSFPRIAPACFNCSSTHCLTGRTYY